MLSEDVPLDFQLGTPQPKEGYTLYPASFQGNDGKKRIDCWFTVPEGKGPFPAMLALHGHGGSRDAVFDSTRRSTTGLPIASRGAATW